MFAHHRTDRRVVVSQLLCLDCMSLKQFCTVCKSKLVRIFFFFLHLGMQTSILGRQFVTLVLVCTCSCPLFIK